MRLKGIKNGKLVLRDCILENKAIIYDERIVDIVEEASCSSMDVEWMDAGGKYIAPGFIDIHIHGAFGFDAMDEDINALREISRRLLENGVTAFLPTTITMPKERIWKALDNIRINMEKPSLGACILGAHLEGPFINPKRKGAHLESEIVKPDISIIKDYLDMIKIITIAPEVQGGLEFIKDIIKQKTTVLSIGHSDATYEEAIKAIDEGVASATHVFNAMTGLNHREPGVVGAVLTTDIFCELISDLIHVHPAAFSILLKSKGMDKIVLITDSIRAASMGDGIYDLGDQSVEISCGCAKLKDGTLAGSVVKLNEAIRDFMKSTGCDLCNVVAMASLNPAMLLGIDKERGSLEKDKYADIVIFDENINISSTIVKGIVKYLPGPC